METELPKQRTKIVFQVRLIGGHSRNAVGPISIYAISESVKFNTINTYLGGAAHSQAPFLRHFADSFQGSHSQLPKRRQFTGKAKSVSWVHFPNGTLPALEVCSSFQLSRCRLLHTGTRTQPDFKWCLARLGVLRFIPIWHRFVVFSIYQSRLLHVLQLDKQHAPAVWLVRSGRSAHTHSSWKIWKAFESYLRSSDRKRKSEGMTSRDPQVGQCSLHHKHQ